MSQLRSIFSRREAVYAAAMIPLVWSAVAACCPAVPHPAAAATPVEPLAFDQYSVNLRDVELQPVFEGAYRFENVGSNPLTITDFEPSCGCLRPKLAGDRRTYQPGEVGYFAVRVATANEPPGPHAYTIKVHYEAPEPHEALVQFKLSLPERKVTVEPRELAFFQHTGTPNTATIYVTDYRGKEIGVTRARSTAEYIDVEIEDAVLDDSGNTRIPVVLHVPAIVPSGRHVTTLAIETTDPEFREIRIPVLVDGPSRIQQTGAEATVPPPPRRP